MSARLSRVLFLTSFAAVAGSCGPEGAEPAGTVRTVGTAAVTPDAAAGPCLPAVIVDPGWLAPRLAAGEVVLVDARSAADYVAGHVAGAISLPVASTFHKDAARKDDLAPAAELQLLLGNAGIGRDLPVVVYDGGREYRQASRLFWTLEVYGHPAAGVLDGGFAGWKAQGRAVSTEPTKLAAKPFVALLDKRRLETKLGVRIAVEGRSAFVVDARAADEYAGRKSVTARAGHIPTAVNIDCNSNLGKGEAGCRFADVDTLRSLYAAIPAGERVITYCNSGNRASVSYLALRAAGRDAAMYDGSFTEWSADPELPVATGEGDPWPASAPTKR